MFKKYKQKVFSMLTIFGILFSNMVIVNNVRAAGGNIFGSNLSVKAGDNISVPIIGAELLNVGAIDTSISFDNTKLTLTGYGFGTIPSSATINPTSNSFSISWGDGSSAIDLSGTLFTLSFTVIGNPGEDDSNLVFGQSSVGGVTANIIYSGIPSPIVIHIKNNVATLTSITGVTLNESFSSSIKTYTADVPYSVDSITLGATKTDSNATIADADLGAKPLNIGSNNFTINVLAEDGLTSDAYNITVIRGADIDGIFDTVSNTLTGYGIVNNLDTVTSSNYKTFSGLSFEKVGYGKIVFNSSLDLSNNKTQEFLQAIGNKLDMSQNGVISLNFSGVTNDVSLKNTSATIKFYNLNLLGFTDSSTSDEIYSKLIAKDDFGNSIDKMSLVSTEGIYLGACGVGETCYTFTIDVNHFTRYEIDNVAPTATVSHNETLKTITYTFSEPMYLRDSAGTLINESEYASKLGIYVITDGNYSLDTKTANVIDSAVLSSDRKTMTVTYDGSLIKQTQTSYVVDAWGYRITDALNNKMVASSSQIFTVNGDNVAPTATVSHNETLKTITYTFSEPMYLRDSAGTLINESEYASKLGIYVITDGNYSLDTKTTNVIDSAVLSSDRKTMTVTYDGSLIKQTQTSYVVDAWGYRITDALNNKMVASSSQIFTVLTATQIAPDENTGNATINNETPEVVITNPTQGVNITINSETTNPKIDVSSLIVNGTGIIPAINVTSNNADNVNIQIPDSTTVTSDDISWNGVIAAPNYNNSYNP